LIFKTVSSELRVPEMGCVFPGLPKRNPELTLANAFGVLRSLKIFSNSQLFYFLCKALTVATNA